MDWAYHVTICLLQLARMMDIQFR